MDSGIVSGPFDDSEKEKHIKAEVLRQLQTYVEKTEAEAEQIYQCKLKDERAYPEIDLNIYKDGASFLYDGNHECRLQVVTYNLEPKIEIITPKGLITAKEMPGEEYPGIAVLFDLPGEPGIITEYNPIEGRYMARVYSIENPDDEPNEIIKF